MWWVNLGEHLLYDIHCCVNSHTNLPSQGSRLGVGDKNIDTLQDSKEGPQVVGVSKAIVHDIPWKEH